MPTHRPDRAPVHDPRALAAGLRAEVLAFKARSPRGLVPAEVRVGVPGGCASGPVREVMLDAHLRMETALVLCDVVRAEVEAPVLWLTRAGSPEPAQLDEAWWATTMAVWREQGLDPAFAVVTRQGWRLGPGDEWRQWRRVR